MKLQLLFLIPACYFIFGVNLEVDADVPKVRILQGKLEGKYILTRGGRNVSAFLGIPYAQPPTGNLRFAAPQPPSAWEGVRDAASDGLPCVQLLTLGDLQVVFGFEDCLFLNVYTPKVSNKRKLPVMIYLHGGGYIWGSGSSTVYGPEYLLDKDIVLVTINYRLGPLGFLSMEDNVIPGNYGFKDQSTAFRWVRDNIKRFGGDPDSVTIFGESAGGSSVHYHMKSPLSKGLFHRAISQSGSSLCSWTNSPAGLYSQHGAYLASLVECPSSPTTSMLDCLRSVSPYAITQALVNFTVWDVDPPVPFPPSIEPKDVEDAFMTADPWTIPTFVPWLTGILSEEGAFRTSTLTKDSNPVQRLQELNDNFGELGSLTLMFDKTAADPIATALEVRQFYFGDQQISNQTLKEVVNMYTDAYFLYCCKEAVRRHFGVVFLYYFSYDGQNSLQGLYGNTRDDLGVCHADDLLYLFTLKDFVPVRNPSSADDQLSDNVVELWTNFAIYGNPTPPDSPFIWPPVCSDNNYLNISNDGFIRQTSLLTERDNFWANLNYREKPPLNPRYWDCLEDVHNTCS